MKDVPSTERMVMCSQRWKLLKQNEKDAYQKRCEQVNSASPSCINKNKLLIQFYLNNVIFFLQRKKEFEIEMNRFLSVSFIFWFLLQHMFLLVV